MSTLSQTRGYSMLADYLPARIKSVLRRIKHRPLHRPDVKLPWVMLGSDYGGWPMVPSLTPDNPLVFSFGVGRDITFDLAVIERFGARVHAFDPTPKSLEWISTQEPPQSLIFHPVGIAGVDGEVAFHPPENDAYVSFSAQTASGGSTIPEPVYASVRSLSSLTAEFGFPDVVKMDIEGFEYEVIEDLLAGDFRPHHLLVEFHHRMYGIADQATLDQVARLRQDGYEVFYVADAGHEYGLVHSSVLERTQQV